VLQINIQEPYFKLFETLHHFLSKYHISYLLPACGHTEYDNPIRPLTGLPLPMRIELKQTSVTSSKYPAMLKLLYALLLCGLTSNAQVLIKNVNVIDVGNQKILEGYDVVALNGKITWVGHGRQFKLPRNTTVIDGTGKYLMPGLNDAHVHFFQSGGLYTRPDAMDLRKYRPYKNEIKWAHDHMEDFLAKYLEAGITSVADVGSTFNFLRQRDSLLNKVSVPLIYMTGPLLTTYVPKEFEGLGNDAPFIKMVSVENTVRAVHDEIKHKSDFIKIWYIVTDTNLERGARANFKLVKAAITAAHKNKLRVAVHATERITAQLAVEAGADYLVHDIENEVVQDNFVNLLKNKHVVLCPTLVVGGNYGKVFAGKYSFSNDELKLDNPEQVKTITDYPLPDTVNGKLMIDRLANGQYLARKRTTDSICAVNLKKFVDAGVTIATGTDAGNIGTQHAGSYFTELEAMQRAGLNMWQLITCSTINGAKAMGKENSWGSITIGKRANMILLTANPVQDLGNWRKLSAVINKGVVINIAP
jgi:imidazolonepropionase-like amidohydrolase